MNNLLNNSDNRFTIVPLCCIVNQTDYNYLHFSGETLFLFYGYLKCFGIIVSCFYFWVLFKVKKCKDFITSLIIIQPRTGDIDSDQRWQVLRETGDRTQTPGPGHCIEQWPALKPRARASV